MVSPSNFPCLAALLRSLLRTYPLPSFDGITPSFTRKVTALEWSVITFSEKFSSLTLPFWLFVNLAAYSNNVKRRSVSMLLDIPCTIAAILSSPAPVSIFFLGSGCKLPILAIC